VTGTAAAESRRASIIARRGTIESPCGTTGCGGPLCGAVARYWTLQEHLLVIVSEECAELAQRATKALRFGLDEVQPGQTLTNRQRIRQEYTDLVAVLHMLDLSDWDVEEAYAKQVKVRKYLKYSMDVGTLP
jgi:hypothetical protein